MNEELLSNKNYSGDEKIVQRAKTLKIKIDDLILMPRIHMVKEIIESHKLSSDFLRGREREREKERESLGNLFYGVYLLTYIRPPLLESKI